MLSLSVVSDSLRPYGLQPTRHLCPWGSPGKNTGVGFHFLLQGIPTQGSNPCLLCLLYCRQVLYHQHHQPKTRLYCSNNQFKFQWLNTTKVYFSLCPASRAGRQGTLLSTGKTPLNTGIYNFYLKKKRTAESHNGDGVQNFLLKATPDTLFQISKADHTATGVRGGMQCCHVSRKRAGLSVHGPREVIRVPLATKGCYVPGEIFVWLLFKMGQTVVLVKYVSTTHTLCSRCAAQW